MVYDTNPEFITGGGLKTPEIETALLTENYDEAARLVKQELMGGIEAEHASIYQPPEPPKTKLTSQQEAQNRAIEAYNTIIEDPVEYAKTKLRGGFKSAEGDSKITLEIGSEEKTYDLKNQDQFLEFMEVARENSGIATGNSEGAELARNEFLNLTKNKSLEVSRFYKAKAKERKKGVEGLQEQLMPQFFAPQTLSDLPILK